MKEQYKAKGYVIDIINQSHVVINAGSKDDIQLNDTGEFYIELPILDIKINKNLGYAEIPIAAFTVNEVYDKFSIVVPLDRKLEWEDDEKDKFNIKEEHNQHIPKEIDFGTKFRIVRNEK